MSRYFISQPMRGRDNEEIIAERTEYEKLIKRHDPEAQFAAMIDQDICIQKTPLECLGISIQRLANADLVVFLPNWFTAPGCFIEHACCIEYKIKHLDLIFGFESEHTAKSIANAICELKGAYDAAS